MKLIDLKEIDKISIIIFYGESKDQRREKILTFFKKQRLVVDKKDGRPIVKGCQVSISHSKKVSVLTLSQNVIHGIDIERIRDTYNQAICRLTGFRNLNNKIDRYRIINRWVEIESALKLEGSGIKNFDSIKNFNRWDYCFRKIYLKENLVLCIATKHRNYQLNFLCY